MNLKKTTYSENELISFWGYYGVTYSSQAELPELLPERLIVLTIKEIKNIDYSKTFSLMLDWLSHYSSLLRNDLLIIESKILNQTELQVLCGILEISNIRKFDPVIKKILSRNKIVVIESLGSQGRVSSFGADPIMKKYGIICSTIDRVRDEKKILPMNIIHIRNLVLRNRMLIGANARADYASLRILFPYLKNSEIYEVAHISRSSGVEYSRNMKFLIGDSYKI